MQIFSYLTERNENFADRVVARKSVVVEDVQVQHSTLQLLDGKSWNENFSKNSRQLGEICTKNLLTNNLRAALGRGRRSQSESRVFGSVAICFLTVLRGNHERERVFISFPHRNLNIRSRREARRLTRLIFSYSCSPFPNRKKKTKRNCGERRSWSKSPLNDWILCGHYMERCAAQMFHQDGLPLAADSKSLPLSSSSSYWSMMKCSARHLGFEAIENLFFIGDAIAWNIAAICQHRPTPRYGRLSPTSKYTSGLFFFQKKKKTRFNLIDSLWAVPRQQRQCRSIT